MNEVVEPLIGEEVDPGEVPEVVMAVVTSPREFVCVCGQGHLTEYQLNEHPKTKAHRENMQGQGAVQLEVNGPWELMPADLQTAIDTCPIDPLMAAKMVRKSFTNRHWPNRTHPGSVREFMEEYKMAIFDASPNINLTQSEISKIRNEQIEEYLNGQQH